MILPVGEELGGDPFAPLERATDAIRHPRLGLGTPEYIEAERAQLLRVVSGETAERGVREHDLEGGQARVHRASARRGVRAGDLAAVTGRSAAQYEDEGPIRDLGEP